MSKVKKLPADFYMRDTLTVARDLIGCLLVRETSQGAIIGRITEDEAYLGIEDKASHAYKERRTNRTAPLYEEGGIAYIHLIYGMYCCFNIVTQPKGVPQSSLIRGVEIIEGHDIAALNRFGKPYDDLTKQQLKNFTNGPGKLCMAMQIDTSLNRESMRSDTFFVCDQYDEHFRTHPKVVESKRIGIDYAEEAIDFLYRFNSA